MTPPAGSGEDTKENVDSSSSSNSTIVIVIVVVILVAVVILAATVVIISALIYRKYRKSIKSVPNPGKHMYVSTYINKSGSLL